MKMTYLVKNNGYPQEQNEGLGKDADEDSCYETFYIEGMEM